MAFSWCGPYGTSAAFLGDHSFHPQLLLPSLPLPERVNRHISFPPLSNKVGSGAQQQATTHTRGRRFGTKTWDSAERAHTIVRTTQSTGHALSIHTHIHAHVCGRTRQYCYGFRKKSYHYTHIYFYRCSARFLCCPAVLKT